jgi:hypothetical protein
MKAVVAEALGSQFVEHGHPGIAEGCSFADRKV